MKKSSSIISLIIGLGIFGLFLYRVGPEAITRIIQNIDFFYLILYFILTTAIFFVLTLRWNIILKAYDKRIPFKRLLKQTIASYAVAYVTPSVRLGGEPLRVYMLKKEAGIDYRTGSASIIIDKFVEFLGTILFGIIGLIILLTLPISLTLKIILATLILGAGIFIFGFYYFSIKGKGTFTRPFNLLRLYKFKRLKKFHYTLKDIEEKIEDFFNNHKKDFILSMFAYFLHGIIMILEMKVLFLVFGYNANIAEIVLSLTILGLVNFIPVPAGLGFLEAGQSSLFQLLKGQGSIGFALSLIIRLRNIIFVAIGFALISHFSTEQVKQRIKRNKNIKKEDN